MPGAGEIADVFVLARRAAPDPLIRTRSPRLPMPAVALLLAGAALACLLAGPARAQGREAPPCPEGRISRVFVDNHSVFDLSEPGFGERFAWAFRLANSLHVATREEVIRREIVVGEGDCYDVELLRDSERLLRSLGFIADVDVFGVRQEDGSIHVIVDTRDEWSLRIDPRIGGAGESLLTGLSLREDNLLGTGTEVGLFYRDLPEEKVYGAGYRTPQLLGTRWDAEVEAGKTPLGYLVSQALTYPFVGETGSWALRQAVRHNDRYFEYRLPSPEGVVRVLHPERRLTFDVGAVHRWGKTRFSRTVLGGVLTGQWLSYPAEARYAREGDLRLGVDPLPPLGLDTIATIRAMGVVGQRSVRFVRRRGLDTVRGTEDVRLGTESQLALGPSIPLLSEQRDLALGFGFFAAGELPRLGLGGVDLLMEGRRRYDAPVEESEWRDVFAQLQGWAYLRPSDDARSTLVASVVGAGGWHVGVPFQLTLGAETGLRGYADHLYSGSRRVVASLEHRRYLGWPLPELLDLGTVAFVDVGKIWAGDLPYGVDSSVRGNVGFGLRAAFPPGSRRALRLDVGVPLRPGIGFGDLVLSLGVGQRIGFRANRRDPQLRRSAHLVLSPSLLAFPGD
jgi:hypothetical protein